MTNWISPAQVYGPGKEFDLFPYEPCDPHGSGSYISIPLPPDLPPDHIRAFDTDADYTKTKAKVQIDEIIHVGDDEWSQVVRCKVLQPPMDERDSSFNSSLAEAAAQPLVFKAYDYEYYPSSFGGPWENNEEADGRFSREYSAYEYYQSNHRGGYPESMPKFYGGWVIKLDAGKDEQGLPKSRYVGLILIEYIQGRSIESLCFRDYGDDWEGPLRPITSETHFRKTNGDDTSITFTKEIRQLVIKKMLHGIAISLHMGVQHRECKPKNVFITMQKNNEDLQELRVVFLDHADTEVFELTKEGAGLGPPILTRLPFPPHPWHRCKIGALESFYGWWPLPPTYLSDEGEERKAEELRVKEFDDWLVSPEVFGPLKEAKVEWDQLQAEGKPWPHPYAKYSIFDTLHQMRKEKVAAAKAREEARALEEAKKAKRDAAKKNVKPLVIRTTTTTSGRSPRPSPTLQSGSTYPLGPGGSSPQLDWFDRRGLQGDSQQTALGWQSSPTHRPGPQQENRDTRQENQPPQPENQTPSPESLYGPPYIPPQRRFGTPTQPSFASGTTSSATRESRNTRGSPSTRGSRGSRGPPRSTAGGLQSPFLYGPSTQLQGAANSLVDITNQPDAFRNIMGNTGRGNSVRGNSVRGNTGRGNTGRANTGRGNTGRGNTGRGTRDNENKEN